MDGAFDGSVFDQFAQGQDDRTRLALEEGGTVRVRWTVEEGQDSAAPVLRFRWQEKGGPPSAGRGEPGLGMRLIEGGLSADFGGQARIVLGPEGASFSLDAPLPRKTERTIT